jgi:integrase
MADSTRDTGDTASGPTDASMDALVTTDTMLATMSVGTSATMSVGMAGSASTAAAHGVLDYQVSEATRRRVAAGVAANTTTAYTRQWAAFTAWCAAAGRVALPATTETLAEYVTHLAELDQAPATIAQAVATIRTHHRLAGHPAQPDTEAARLVQRAHRRERADRGHRPGKATPITIEPLRAMMDTCDPATLTGARDRAVLVLGVAMMARRSELAALHAGDVAFTDDGLLVYVRSSKTDQDAHGIEVAIPPGAHADTDPVRVLAA